MILDCIVIGGGPAGLTAGVYLKRFNRDIVIVDDKIGGQLLDTELIENFPSIDKITGVELTLKLKEQCEKLSCEFLTCRVVDIKQYTNNFFCVSLNNNKIIESKTILLATGAVYKFLEIPGERKFLGKGVSFCVACDAFFYFNLDVVIIGGGNSALTSAMTLSNIAKTVTIINKNSTFKGDVSLLKQCQNKSNIIIHYNSLTKEIYGEDIVEGIIINKNNSEFKLPTNGVFIKIGMLSCVDLVKDKILLNNYDEIIIDEHNRTSVTGMFAAGDVTNNPYKQIVIASGAGANSAISINDFLLKLDV